MNLHSLIGRGLLLVVNFAKVPFEPVPMVCPHPLHPTDSCTASCRSDGSLVVADRNKEEKVLAPPGSGATVVYRLGHYNILLPKTTHSEEPLIQNCEH